MIELSDLGYLWLVFKISGVSVLLGWCLAWRHYEKYKWVGPPFMQPPKKNITDIFD
jgi:hypothetical protein